MICARASLAKVKADHAKLVQEKSTLKNAEEAQHDTCSAPGGAEVNAEGGEGARVDISREDFATLVQACNVASVLKQELADLKASHSLLSAQNTALAAKSCQESGGGPSVGMCTNCETLEEQLRTKEVELMDTKKMLHASKIQLASRIGAEQVFGAEVFSAKVSGPHGLRRSHTIRGARDQHEGLEALLATRDEQLAAREVRIKELEEAAQDFERQMTSLKLEFHNHLIGKTMKSIKTTCSATQTEPPRVSSHTRWLWLLSLRIQVLPPRFVIVQIELDFFDT